MVDARVSLSLDEIGILEGTDKSSLMNNYLQGYEEALSPYKELSINLLEIGVLGGASLRTWRQYFPKATLVGVDIDPSCTRFESDRTFVRIGSQSDPEFLARVAAEFPPTIIIDDGSHRTDDILFTFDRLFPVLEPAGCYIIEDLYLHSADRGTHLQGIGASTPFDMLLPLARALLEKAAPKAGDPHMTSYVTSHIEKMALMPGAAIISKRVTSESMTEYIQHVKELFERPGNNGNWLHLLDFILAKNGPLDHAEEAGRRAIAAAPRFAHGYVRLAVVLEKRGDLAGAIAAVRQAVQFAAHPDHAAHYNDYLAKLRNRSPPNAS